jgi:hypothetical protein
MGTQGVLQRIFCARAGLRYFFTAGKECCCQRQAKKGVREFHICTESSILHAKV